MIIVDLKKINCLTNLPIMPFILLFSLVTCFLPVSQSPVRYVALGDSYTICTGAEESQSWPLLLSKHLKQQQVDIQLIANPAQNGWTTKDVIDKELPVLDQSKATFVTLLIGVNDWVRGVSEEEFRHNLVYIIDHIQSKLPDKAKLLLLTIPDFSVTPTGAQYSKGRNISAGIDSFNRIIKEEASKRGLATVDLFETSKKMKSNPDLVAADGLHPSAKEYSIWEELIFPVAYKMLQK